MKTRILFTAAWVVIYGALLSIGLYAQSMYQGVIAAQQINDDSIAGNAMAMWVRNTNFVDGIGTLVFLVVLAWVWWPTIKAQLQSTKEISDESK